MIYYHASNMEVSAPDLFHSRDYLDFEKGFYMTSIREQATKYAERFRLRGEDAFINEYELSDNLDGHLTGMMKNGLILLANAAKASMTAAMTSSREV